MTSSRCILDSRDTKNVKYYLISFAILFHSSLTPHFPKRRIRWMKSSMDIHLALELKARRSAGQCFLDASWRWDYETSILKYTSVYSDIQLDNHCFELFSHVFSQFLLSKSLEKQKLPQIALWEAGRWFGFFTGLELAQQSCCWMEREVLKSITFVWYPCNSSFSHAVMPSCRYVCASGSWREQDDTSSIHWS